MKDKTIHVGNIDEIEEEFPRDFDLDFLDPMDDIDESSTNN